MHKFLFLSNNGIYKTSKKRAKIKKWLPKWLPKIFYKNLSKPLYYCVSKDFV